MDDCCDFGRLKKRMSLLGKIEKHEASKYVNRLVVCEGSQVFT